MFRFGVENLRRLHKVDSLELRPITLLVGRNSSGKSSFLRALPLLRQSILTRTSSPILWYGDLADFGSFEGAVTDNNKDLSIAFEFGLDQVQFGRRGFIMRAGSYVAAYTGSARDVGLTLRLRDNGESARLSEVRMSIEQETSTFVAGLDDSGQIKSLTLDGGDILDLFKTSKMILPQGSILPDLLVVADEAPQPNASFYVTDEFNFTKAVADITSEFLDKRIKANAMEALAHELLSLPTFEPDQLRKLADQTRTRTWKKLISDVASKDRQQLFQPLKRIHTANRFVPLLRAATERLRQTLAETLYIGPARARSERYYRYQDLAVSEIDPDGKNFAMFLNSLSQGQLDSLSDWVQELFGYRISTLKSTGHISINLVEGSSETNIVDTGYGVSQILPVLGQIWWASNRERGSRTGRSNSDVSILDIEQPELHLHPAHQALLADALCERPNELIRSRKSPRTNFLIETHSETLVNRLGELIANKRLSAEDVQIVLFEPSSDGERRTNVRISTFNDAGELMDWPYGFFQPH